MGEVFHRRLGTLRSMAGVGDVRGRGLLAGVELVRDVETRAPFPRDWQVAERFTKAAQDAGLIVWPNVGQADGVNGDLVCLAPPFTITESEIATIVERFAVALEQTMTTPSMSA